jgi:hypothetical protein
MKKVRYMQLTISGTEIETVIREYVNNLMNLRADTGVTIELVAARNAEGFRAMVDILPITAVKPVTAPVVAAPEPAPVVAPVAVFSRARPPQSPAEVRQMLEQEEITEEAVPPPVVVTPTADVEPPFAVSEEVPFKVVAKKSHSLFKDLTKPVNG